MTDCIFCKIENGQLESRKLYEDEYVFVIADIHPQAPVHLLVIPKRHVGDITDADDALIAALLRMVRRVIADKQVARHRIVINGRGAQIVEHLHVHIMGGVEKARKL